MILQIFLEYVPDSRTVLGDGIQGGISSSFCLPRAHGKIYNKQRFPRASQVVLGVKNPPANAADRRDTGSIPGSRRSLERGGHGNPLQCSCLENPMQLKQFSTHACMPLLNSYPQVRVSVHAHTNIG